MKENPIKEMFSPYEISNYADKLGLPEDEIIQSLIDLVYVMMETDENFGQYTNNEIKLMCFSEVLGTSKLCNFVAEDLERDLTKREKLKIMNKRPPYKVGGKKYELNTNNPAKIKNLTDLLSVTEKSSVTVL
jgi:hypothetical protein